jgi:hypothetical protein
MRSRLIVNVIALLALAAVFTLGARGARGQGTTFRVIGPGTVVVGESVYLLDTGNGPAGWKQLPLGTLTLPPVPVSSLVNYASGVVAITDSGEGWGKVGGVWMDLGPVPNGSMPARQESWGQLKVKYAH